MLHLCDAMPDSSKAVCVSNAFTLSLFVIERALISTGDWLDPASNVDEYSSLTGHACALSLTPARPGLPLAYPVEGSVGKSRPSQANLVMTC